MTTQMITTVSQTVHYSTRLTTVGDSYSITPMACLIEVSYATAGMDINKVLSHLDTALSPFHNALAVSVRDAQLPYLLSPKNGMSIQEVIAWIKEEPTFVQNGFLTIGTEVPPLTANGVKVLACASEPMMETVLRAMSLSIERVFSSHDLSVEGVRMTNPTYGTSLTIYKAGSVQISMF